MLFSFNWIDLLMILVCWKVWHTGTKSNIPVEGLRLLGVCVTTFVVLHYYSRFALFLHKALATPHWINIQVSIILLWLTTFFVFKFTIDSWSLILKSKPKPIIDAWGGGLIACVRAIFVCGLLYVALLASGNATVDQLTRSSYLSRYLLSFSPAFYAQCHERFVVDLFKKEEINTELFELLEGGQGSESDG